MKRSRIIGQAGSDNYRVENMPVHLPKENMNLFYFMQDRANEEPFNNYRQYGNAYHDDWQEQPSKPEKGFYRIQEAVKAAVNNALNEYAGRPKKSGLSKYELMQRANKEREFLKRKFINSYLKEYPDQNILKDDNANDIVFQTINADEIYFLIKVNINGNINFSVSKNELEKINDHDAMAFLDYDNHKVYLIPNTTVIDLYKSQSSMKYYANDELGINQKLSNTAYDESTYAVIPIQEIQKAALKYGETIPLY